MGMVPREQADDSYQLRLQPASITYNQFQLPSNVSSTTLHGEIDLLCVKQLVSETISL